VPACNDDSSVLARGRTHGHLRNPLGNHSRSLWKSAAVALGNSYLDRRRRRGPGPKCPGENSRSPVGSLDGFCRKLSRSLEFPLSSTSRNFIPVSLRRQPRRRSPTERFNHWKSLRLAAFVHAHVCPLWAPERGKPVSSARVRETSAIACRTGAGTQLRLCALSWHLDCLSDIPWESTRPSKDCQGA
jgi:hypothetical protein